MFTVITATYNAASTLPALAKSLAVQTCRDFVWVVQDGESTDATLEIVEAWRESLPTTSVESMKDKGIYDAWNRALDRQGENLGQWVLFLGADDVLSQPDVLERVQGIMHNGNPRSRFWAGMMDVLDSEGKLLRHVIPRAIVGELELRVALARHFPFGHGALFHAGHLFAKERFDANYQVCGDYDFVCRLAVGDNAVSVLPITITNMRAGGISTMPEKLLRIRWEEFQVARRYIPKYYVWDFWRLKALCKAACYYLIFKYIRVDMRRLFAHE